MRLFFMRLILLSMLFIFSFPSTGQSIEQLAISAQNAVMIEQETGRVIYEKKAHEQKPIASITKVMTAIIAIEQGKLKDQVIASREAVHTIGSSIYLQEGEEMSLEDLLYGLMLRSGNDAAVAIAEHIGGSEEGFVFLMNEKARYIGMTNTNFVNAHGLDEDSHYSTAYDMAILMQYAMKNDVFKKISSTESYLPENRTYYWRNKNKLLTNYYEFCTGGKTGYTRKAGRTLVSTANKNDLDFITVTLNAPDDWNDHQKLFDWGYEHYHLVLLEKKGQRLFTLTEDESIQGYLKDDIVFPLSKEEEKLLTRQVYLEKQPIEDKLGKIVYQLHSEAIIEIPVYEEVQKSDHHFYHRIINVVKRVFWLGQDG